MFHTKGHDGPVKYPMKAVPSEPTGLINPKVGKAHGLPKPAKYGSEEFKENLAEVEQVVRETKGGIWAGWFFKKHNSRKDYDGYRMPGPLAAIGFTTADPLNVAMSVHMDDPIEFAMILIKWLKSEGCELAKPETKGLNFLGSTVDVIKDCANAVWKNMHKCFEAKYFFGQVRPEAATVAGNPKLRAQDVTTYADGCPAHPSYPAGHAVNLTTIALEVLKHFKTTVRQRNEVMDAAYVRLMARSLAGVHFAEDNLAGGELAGHKY